MKQNKKQKRLQQEIEEDEALEQSEIEKLKAQCDALIEQLDYYK